MPASDFYIPVPDFIVKLDEVDIVDAFNFAMFSHAEVEQKRKYTGEPYINHPVAVARIIYELGGTKEQIMAALLHDVVEDTNATIEMVRIRFGDVVANMVAGLTDVSQPEDGNRATRKAIDRKHSAEQPAEVQTIKVADLMDNTKSITEYDPNFAVVYITEKALLLDMLKLADKALKKVAWAQIRRFQEGSLQTALAKKG